MCEIAAIMRTLMAFIYLFIFSHLHSQNFELLNIEYAVFPEVSVQEDGSREEIQLNEYGIQLNIPMLFKEKQLAFIHGLTYRYVQPAASTVAIEKDLHYISYSLSFLTQISTPWRMLVRYNPAISSDLSADLSSNDFLHQGSVLFTKTVSKKFSWGIGGIYTSRFGSPLAIPILQLKHEKDNFKLNVLLPTRISTMWNAKEKLSCGIDLSVSGSQYHINSSFNQANIDVVNFSRVVLAPQLNYQIADPVILSIALGIATARTFEFDLENIEDQNFDLENGPFVSIGLKIVPQKESNNLT